MGASLLTRGSIGKCPTGMHMERSVAGIRGFNGTKILVRRVALTLGLLGTAWVVIGKRERRKQYILYGLRALKAEKGRKERRCTSCTSTGSCRSTEVGKVRKGGGLTSRTSPER